jgi:hypothetical protein
MDMLTLYVLVQFAGGFQYTHRAIPMTAAKCLKTARRLKRTRRYEVRTADGGRFRVYCAPPPPRPMRLAR